MEKRLIIAIIVSIAIMMSFQILAPKQPIVQPLSVENKQTGDIVKEKVSTSTLLEPISEEFAKFDNSKFSILFTNIGGSIKSIKLKNYKELKSDAELELFSLENFNEYICNISSNFEPGLEKAAYSAQKLSDGILYSYDTKNFRISKRYIFNKDTYGLECYVDIKNITTNPLQFRYDIIGGSGLSEKDAGDKRFVEVIANIDGKQIGFKRPKPEVKIANPGMVGWAALKNKYFSLIIKPFSSTTAQYYKEISKDRYVMSLSMDAFTIQPGASVEQKFVLYAGPSHIPALKEVGHGFDETVNYGFFGIISKAILFVLRFFYTITHSWGFSIILLSIFLNILTFPLTANSFKSMKKMQELHPQMEALKKQYKDNAQKLNQEIMGLYKKYNINPLSGCLPILLQMPIFFALYQALLKSIELRNTGFLWIKDLTSPDALRIPIDLPLIGNAINILPIIMIIAMVIQQKISTSTMGSAVTAEQREQQKIMLFIMPVVFGFVFYNMPSGLVLYWVVNTILTIAEQSVMLKEV